jgi:hypothetical protein
MSDGSWFLWFGLVCIGLILAAVVAMAFGKIAAFGSDDSLPRPDPQCEREAAKHFKVGGSVSGWRR